MTNSKVQKTSGYVSQDASDAGSARLSNRQTFKYNGPNPKGKISKIQPNDNHYSSGGEGSLMFPSITNGPLPVVKESLYSKQKTKSRSTNRSSVIYKHR